MSALKREARQLLERATRNETLPSREHMQRVRSAVLRRAAVGGAAAAVVSTSLWAKAAAIVGASAALQMAAYAAVGALAGAAVVQVSVRSWAPVDAAQVSVAASSDQVTSSGAPLAATALAPSAPAWPAPPTAPSSLVLEPSTALSVVSDRPKFVAAPTQLPLPASESARVPAPGALRQRTSGAFIAPPAALAAPVPITDIAAPPDAAAPQVATPPSVNRDTVARQLDVLRAMRDDLSGKRAHEAHDLYRTNQQLFAGSALEVEARAAFIAALCQQGRHDEAARESASLLQAFPVSQVAQRVASGCPSAKNAGR